MNSSGFRQPPFIEQLKAARWQRRSLNGSFLRHRWPPSAGEETGRSGEWIFRPCLWSGRNSWIVELGAEAVGFFGDVQRIVNGHEILARSAEKAHRGTGLAGKNRVPGESLLLRIVRAPLAEKDAAELDPRVTGGLRTLLIITSFIGIPVMIFGWWTRKRARTNIEAIESAFAEYLSSLGLKSPVAA